MPATSAGMTKHCVSISFRLDAGGLDDVWPAFQFVLDEGVELLRRAANDVRGLRSGDGGTYRRHLQYLIEHAIDARNQHRIHTGRPQNAVPNTGIEARNGLGD